MSTDYSEEIGSMQLSDSFFPSGMFATSNGIEKLFLEKRISAAEELAELIRIFINQQTAPLDCVALSNVYEFREDFEKILEIDEMVYSMKTIKEIREASTRSGIQTLRCITEIQNEKLIEKFNIALKEKKAYGTYPVSFALACMAMKISKEKALSIMLYGFVTSVVGAALRLGMIQHFEGQKIIHKLKPTMSDAINQYINKSYLEMWQFAPQVDTFQMSHEKMDSKMFIT